VYNLNLAVCVLLFVVSGLGLNRLYHIVGGLDDLP